MRSNTGPPAKKIIIFGETADEFEKFVCELVSALDPKEAIEAQGAERTAICA